MEDKPDEKPMKKIPKKEQMSVPKILKVKDLEEDGRFAGIHENLPKMPCLATQSFRAVSGLIRNNSNAIFICRQQNQKELFKISEEFSDTVGGHDNFIKLYKEIHKIPYQIMYLDLQSNPARVLRNFEEVLWEGDDSHNIDGDLS